ncbi:MAG TPA: FtsX-like permease family protein [Beijerinckiaceae bacterium]|nr:FtsX-like permease family protein [Beijerinckiaceae bacterium]
MTPALSFAGRMRLALRLAARDLRGGIGGFGIFIACIAIGVAAIVSVSVLSRSLQDGLAREGRTILGGDISFSFLQREATPDERAFFSRTGSVTAFAFLRAMARSDTGAATLVELKAVETGYPAFGRLVTRPEQPFQSLFGAGDGLFGVAVDPLLLGRLGLGVGDSLWLGTARFVIRAEIDSEPDRLALGVGFGPRVLMSREGLDASGLVQPGSLTRFAYRIALPGSPPDTASLDTLTDEARRAFPGAGWDIRTRDNAAPQLKRNIERFTQFLTLVGLTSLAVGGVGVANAARAFLDRKRLTVAALKGIGAPGGVMVLTLVVEVLALGLIGTLVGIIAGTGLPILVIHFLAAALPVPLASDLYPREALVGFIYGLATVLAFTLWPLGRAHDIPVSALVRDHFEDDRAWPRRRYMLATALAVLLLAGVAIAFAWDRRIAIIYVAAAAGAFVLLRGVAAAIMALARRLPRPRSTEARLALVNLGRPGALTPSVILSLGLGLTLLVAMGLIDHTMRAQLSRSLPDKAPSFFFLDVPAADTDAFTALVAELAPGATLNRVPMMRGRVTALNGTAAETIRANDKVAWVLEGDRGLTFSAEIPAGNVLAAGQWWPADYAGPPLVSLALDIAEGLGLSIGDSITVNVLGRPVTARIANLRKVEWQNLGISFVLVFSPNTFAGAPYSNLATLTYPASVGPDAELKVLRAVAERFPSVSSIRVKEALETIDGIVAKLALAVRAASAVAILSSIIVLAGALAAGRRVRAQEAVILKTLGATRPRLILAMILEYALLGLSAAIFGLLAGTLAGYAIVTQVMNLTFSLPVSSMLTLVLTTLVLVVILGLIGTWRVLGQKPASYLRNA